ncbi:ankyrin repeat-containing ITN1-like [Olea europaea subsp. europaea]|uniref:Ankyrin repeat-containing ITN1-like n=1 Tax=Olea europaea subsp. europaea TaxID=158383 RepID=A0A8S0SNW1_OLEEU|nr:ankyrin repeat-containing ITN1-like [Olea europaea subsp. europaea]
MMEQPTSQSQEREVDEPSWSRYSGVRHAVIDGIWISLERFFEQSSAFTIRINESDDTALLLAVKVGREYSFIEKMVNKTPPCCPSLLTQKDNSGNTALHAAAQLGNVKIAELLVNKNRELRGFFNNDGLLPIQVAANRGHKGMTSYLLDICLKTNYSNLHEDEAAGSVLLSLVKAKFYDLALKLLQKNPELVRENVSHLELMKTSVSRSGRILELMAEEPSVFQSGTCFGIWGSLIYSLSESPETPGILWKKLEVLVPPMERIRHIKLMHHQASQLFKLTFSFIKTWPYGTALAAMKRPFILAAQNGLTEIVTKILYHFPETINSTDEENHSGFHLAVMYRREKVFKILQQQNIGQDKMFSIDNNRNNILHLAGYRARQDSLDLNRGAILQMQYEIRWFKEMEGLVTSKEIKSKNSDEKTPLAIFNEEHANLVSTEIKWMTESLIVTVAFAAAITVPGGNDRNGLPIFSNPSHQTPFLVFAISDSLALVFSVTSVLSFLSIFTSRYGDVDFLNTLPNRLIIGLIFLLFSVVSLVVAFSTTIFLVFAKKDPLILIPIIISACVPVFFFIELQLPPLLNMINSTYGLGLLGL